MYFECIVGNGGGTSGIPLIVTCTSDFAGLTITATDGTTTLTEQCPSTSPYTVEFELPNDGSWDVSGTVGGIPITETILIQPFEVDLIATQNITVDFYSAASDTVSYTGIDGQTHSIITDTNGHASATILIKSNGSSINFTSQIAKDPDNLSNDYSKTIALTPATTSVYLMPNDNVLYWWGYKSSHLIECTQANGWGGARVNTMSPTYNTRDIYMNTGASDHCFLSPDNLITADSAHAIATLTRSNSSVYILAVPQTNYTLDNTWSVVETLPTENVMTHLNLDISSNPNKNVIIGIEGGRAAYTYAFWVD